jgi:hypothetical protein
MELQIGTGRIIISDAGPPIFIENIWVDFFTSHFFLGVTKKRSFLGV